MAKIYRTGWIRVFSTDYTLNTRCVRQSPPTSYIRVWFLGSFRCSQPSAFQSSNPIGYRIIHTYALLP